jgi:FlgD Ig-like domain
VRRLPVAAFVALAVATIAAFFITQHLKVTTPLLTGSPFPLPAEINPIDGGVCPVHTHLGLQRVSFRSTSVSFYLLHRSDDVDVYIVSADGTTVVKTLASGVHMQGGAHPVRRKFTWNGRTDSGSVAPDGTYYIRVVLIHQVRSVLISNNAGAEPVTVDTVPPRPVITKVTPAAVAAGASAPVTIDYTGTQESRPQILIYRLSGPGRVRLVKTFASTSRAGHSTWNGLIGGRPAPAGTYIVGLRVTDKACNTGTFPSRLPPGAGSEPNAQITVR